MSKYEFHPFQKCMFNLHRIFALLCLVNLILAINFELYGGNDYYFAFLFPFIGLGFFVVSTVVYVLTKGWNTGSHSPYIKENYPEIWQKLHPWGGRSHNSIATFAFMGGEYDDGSDEKLNQIKFNLKNQIWLIIWPVIICLATWMLGIVFLLLSEAS